MNTKILSSLSAALIVTSFVQPAMAEPLGDHPAVVVARTWNNRPIDSNTFIVAPPASTKWVAEAPQTAHTSEPTQLNWTAAIGTGYTARTAKTSHHVTSSDKANVVATPDWTANIGTGTAVTNRQAAPETKASSGIATANWTSKIGSGHPFDSVSPVTSTTVANVR